MSAQNRRSSVSSSSSSTYLVRRWSTSENAGGKDTAAVPHLTKKRPALSNISNQRNGPQNAPRTSVSSKTMVPCTAKIAKMKKGSSTCIHNAGIPGNTLPVSLNLKSSVSVCCKDTTFPRSDRPTAIVTALPAPSGMDTSPSQSDSSSVSLDETMSTCNSLKSPEFEYVDSVDALAVKSIERKACKSLYISEHAEIAGNICKRDIHMEMETTDKVVNIDKNFMDPQFCATIACDIYKHLRASEVSEEYRLVPETLFLTVNYIDRFLSGNMMNRQRLQLLGVACMMIAAKYEEICATQVEEFCYITDNTYFKEVLQMESAVLNYLKFEMTAPTAKCCFLRRFVRAAQGINEVPSMQLECLASYLAELSLLECIMLRYASSLIAASATFLA